MPRLSGSPIPFAPVMLLHVPYNAIQGQTNVLFGYDTIATGSSTDDGPIISPPFDLSIHSIVATVYGAAGTGSLAFSFVYITVNGNYLPLTFVANTLAPQVFGPFKKNQYQIAARANGLYPVRTSSSWVQSKGGLYVTVNAYL